MTTTAQTENGASGDMWARTMPAVPWTGAAGAALREGSGGDLIGIYPNNSVAPPGAVLSETRSLAGEAENGKRVQWRRPSSENCARREYLERGLGQQPRRPNPRTTTARKDGF